MDTRSPRRRSRGFRRARPFWAGVFTIAAGAEILLFPLTPVSSLIQLGVGAVSGVVFGIALLVLGPFMWFSPPNRTLSGVLTILIALASFVTTNLGGLVVGMVLGLIGGGLCLAWTPGPPPPRGGRGADPAPDRPEPRHRLRPDPATELRRPPVRARPVIGALLSTVVLGAVVLGTGVGAPGVAAAQEECLLGLLCPSPPAGTTDAGSSPSPSASPSPSPSPGPGLVLPAVPGDLPGAAGGALAGPPPTLVPARVPALGELLPRIVAPALPSVPSDGRTVSGLISNTGMDTLSVTNFRFLGVVTHPVAGGGSVRALRVVVDSTDIGNLTATAPGPGSTVLVGQRSGSPHASTGPLVLDLTTLRITLFGLLPVEFSLAFPPPPAITIPVLSGTDVDIDFVQLDCAPDIPGIVVGAGPPSAGPPAPDPSPPAAARPSLVGLASLLDQPDLLVPYGLTDAQATQAVAAYEQDPGPSLPASPSAPGPGD